MKRNNIADALRALTVAPSLESETAADSSIVTGDGDQTQTVELKAADETPADAAGAPGEDEKITVKTVEVGERSDLESAETTSTDSPATVAALAATVSAESADGESSTVTGDGDQTTVVKLEDAQTDQQEVEGEDKPGTAKTVEVDNGPKEEAAETESKNSEVVTTTEVSTESADDAADAAAAFAAGAAGAAEAAAAVAEGAPSEPEVVADAAAEVQAAEVAEDTAEVAAAVAEEQADAVDAAAGEVQAEATGELPESTEDDSAIAEGEEVLAELEDSIEAGEEHVEKYEQAQATLESLANAIESAQMTGGMTPQAASFFNVSFESVGVFLTGKPFANARGESPVPSLESYGTTMRRDHATNISMESVQEWLKKVWEVLKKTFAQIKEWLTKFFEAVFSQAERYKQRAEKIEAAAAKLTAANKPRAEKIKFAGASKIVLNGKVTASDLGDLKAFAKEAGERNSEASRALVQVRQDLRAMIERASSGGKWNEGVSESNNLALTAELRSAVFNVAYKGEAGEGFATKDLPGNVKFVALSPFGDSANLAGELLKTAFRGWKVVQISEGEAFEGELAVLTPFHIKEVAQHAKGLIEEVKAAKAELKEESLSIGDLNFPEEIPADQAKAIKRLAWFTTKLIQAQSSSIGKVLKYCVSTTGTYLDFAAASLKQYGAEQVSAESISSDQNVSMEGVQGAIVGALFGFLFMGIGAIPGAIAGHLIEEWQKNKKELEEATTAARKGNEKAQAEVLQLRAKQLDLEQKMIADAKAKDKKAA